MNSDQPQGRDQGGTQKKAEGQCAIAIAGIGSENELSVHETNTVLVLYSHFPLHLISVRCISLKKKRGVKKVR